jgi:alkyl hydroperoxide reductase subunit AhpC
MALQLGDPAPDFFADTTAGPIHFHAWLGSSWGILFSHPADFTPVCTTEIAAAAKMMPLFAHRDVKLIALSLDPLKAHMGWIYDIIETQQTAVNFPIIADPDRHVALLYDMIHPNASDATTVRCVFVIGPDKRIRLTQCYPMSTGRNFVELLRVVDALQLAEDFRVVTPANWHDGDECLVAPTVPDNEVLALFPNGTRRLKPYLRYTPQPVLRRS